MGSSLEKAQDRYGDDPVEFYAVFPLRNSTDSSATHFLEKYHLTRFKPILDPHLQYVEKYDAKVTPELVIINSHNSIIYQGMINDAYFAPGKLKHTQVREFILEAIESGLRGNPMPRPWKDAVGCIITKAAYE